MDLFDTIKEAKPKVQANPDGGDIFPRVLILGCSATKRTGPPMAAIERYDGPFFRVLRKYRDEGGELPMTLILSAQAGLITSSTILHEYDQKMDEKRAKEIIYDPFLRNRFRTYMEGAGYNVFCVMGESYRRIILRWMEEHEEIYFAEGGIGEMQSQLHDWLRTG